MALIEVKNLKKIYQDGEIETAALDGVSFKVEEGEFIAIMGPSGSGKSTLMHVLGLLDEPTEGDYILDGKHIDKYTKEEVAHMRNEKVGFIFQSFNLLPRTSVLENVKLPLVYSSVKENLWNELAVEAIKSVGMIHRINHEPSELSGGEKQRVAIARALVTDPQIIFADEPTGNLDSKSGEMIMNIIHDLSEQEGRTVFLVTHETYTAAYARRIIKLYDGKIKSDEKVRHRHKSKDHFVK